MKVSYIYLVVIAILMWNVMLINRDDQLWKHHYQTKAHKEFCASMTFHPDCNHDKR